MINNNRLNGSGIYGVAVYSGSDIHITNNRLFNNSVAAIKLRLNNNFWRGDEQYQTRDIYIIDNLVYDNPKFIDTRQSAEELSEKNVVFQNNRVTETAP